MAAAVHTAAAGGAEDKPVPRLFSEGRELSHFDTPAGRGFVEKNNARSITRARVSAPVLPSPRRAPFRAGMYSRLSAAAAQNCRARGGGQKK